MDLEAISPKLHVEDAFVKDLQDNDKQEIVIEIQLCTQNSPTEVKNAIIMTTVSEEYLKNEKSTSTKGMKKKTEEKDPSARVQLRHNSGHVKPPPNVAETLGRSRKLALQGKGSLPTKTSEKRYSFSWTRAT